MQHLPTDGNDVGQSERVSYGYTRGTCRDLSTTACLKPGETHCPYCAGYGSLPINRRENMTRFCPAQCGACEGSGKKT